MNTYYQPLNVMIDLLKKAHELQVKVAQLNDGHSIHIDQSSHHDWLEPEVLYMAFDVTLFDETSLEESWTFSARDDKADLEHTFDDLVFNVNKLLK